MIKLNKSFHQLCSERFTVSTHFCFILWLMAGGCCQLHKSHLNFTAIVLSDSIMFPCVSIPLHLPTACDIAQVCQQWLFTAPLTSFWESICRKYLGRLPSKVCPWIFPSLLMAVQLQRQQGLLVAAGVCTAIVCPGSCEVTKEQDGWRPVSTSFLSALWKHLWPQPCYVAGKGKKKC